MRKIKTSGKSLALTILALLVFLFLFSRASYKLLLNSFELYKVNKQLSQETKKNEKLKREAELIKKNSFVEYSARVKLGLKKEVEVEYRFTPPEDDK